MRVEADGRTGDGGDGGRDGGLEGGLEGESQVVLMGIVPESPEEAMADVPSCGRCAGPPPVPTHVRSPGDTGRGSPPSIHRYRPTSNPKPRPGQLGSGQIDRDPRNCRLYRGRHTGIRYDDDGRGGPVDSGGDLGIWSDHAFGVYRVDAGCQ